MTDGTAVESQLQHRYMQLKAMAELTPPASDADSAATSTPRQPER
jgi:hypothetical protein